MSKKPTTQEMTANNIGISILQAPVQEVKLLLASELEEAYGDGKLAAQEGKELNDCPVMNGSLCIEWVKGWKAWQQEHDTDWWQQNKGDGEERPQ